MYSFKQWLILFFKNVSHIKITLEVGDSNG